MGDGVRLRGWLKWIGLPLFGVVLALVILEAVLQVAAVFVGPRQAARIGAREKVILALGDSNTYGARYSQEQAYPGQLQSILDLRVPGRYKVINLGLPGMNSSEVRARLKGWYLQYQPYAAVLCVGINNVWNRAEDDSADASAGWMPQLRVVRLARLLRLNLSNRSNRLPLIKGTGRPELRRVLLADGHEGVEQQDAETGEILARHVGSIHEPSRDVEEAAEVLKRDLRPIDSLSDRYRVQLVLLTYSAFPLPGRRTFTLARQ